MKQAIASIILVIIAVTTAQAASLAQQGDAAYTREDYSAAAQLYAKALAADGPSSLLYYNMGNASYRLGHPGQAVLYYERALRLDPTNSNARQNLEFVNSRLIDKTTDRGSVLSKVTDDAASAAKPNTWAWIAMTLFVVVIGAAATYVFSNNVTLRKTCFFGGGVLLLLVIVTATLAVIGSRKAVGADEAIVTVGSTQLSTSPRAPKDKREEAILLHEGTKVTILDSVATPRDSVNPVWYDVIVDNTHRAWISRSAVEKI